MYHNVKVIVRNWNGTMDRYFYAVLSEQQMYHITQPDAWAGTGARTATVYVDGTFYCQWRSSWASAADKLMRNNKSVVLA